MMASYIDRVLGMLADEPIIGKTRESRLRPVTRAFTGRRREMRYVDSVRCGYCQGSGKDASGSTCGVCKGEGSMKVDSPVVQCLVCRGTGHDKGSLTCMPCRGKGVVSVPEGATTCTHCRGTGRDGVFYCTKCHGQGIA